MKAIKRILCPVDLSENSMATVQMATSLAKQYDATLVFCHVAPQWLPEESMFGSDYIEATIADNKSEFDEVRPTDESVKYERVFLHGNPGPEIVRAAESCDLIVMSTHGNTGILRFLMGSVAEYTLRHATCPVVTCKNVEIKRADDDRTSQPQEYVTELMHHVRPVRGFDEMPDVITELERANESAVPVIDSGGQCIGILTRTDIKKYRELKTRFEKHDETVIDEVFETDKYGQRRASNFDFDQIHRHMTSPVVTIGNTESYRKARELFDRNPNIHHLIVVDDSNCPIGVLELQDITKKFESAKSHND